MTTHVFIVDEKSFAIHLEYMFVGTGSKDKIVDFNNTSNSILHSSTENGLVAMMADGARIRRGDNIIFYVQASGNSEGKFYGIYRSLEDGIALESNQAAPYLNLELGKKLLFRQKIEPFEVYSEGVTEWAALDEIKNITSPCQMIWSLIYRKLKGNRGNTMITIYESERLFDLIRRVNNNHRLPNTTGFKYNNGHVEASNIMHYTGGLDPINILHRLVFKFSHDKAHESHLQQYITQNIGLDINQSLDSILGVNRQNIEWIGNEVSCGVGMQRIDVMISKTDSDIRRTIYPIELKAVCVTDTTVSQLERYVEWVEQYYVPNRMSSIQPVLICKKGISLRQSTINSFNSFNRMMQRRAQTLIYVEYDVINNAIQFNKIVY